MIESSSLSVAVLVDSSGRFEVSRIGRSGGVGGESRRGNGLSLRVGEIVEEIGPILFDHWGNSSSGGVDERGSSDIGNDGTCDDDPSASFAREEEERRTDR